MILEDMIGWIIIPWEERDIYFDRINTAFDEEDITDFTKYYHSKLINGNSKLKIFK